MIFHRSQTEDHAATGSCDGVNSSDGDRVAVNNSEGTSTGDVSIGDCRETPVAQAYEDATMHFEAFDIGSIVQLRKTSNKTTLSDTDKFELLTNHVKPDGKVPLPYQEVKKSGKVWKISFQLSWLTEYSWLVYSPSQKGGFCKFCVLYGNTKHGTLGVLVKSPFTNFRHAKGKDGVLTNHVNNVYHQDLTEHMRSSPPTRIPRPGLKPASVLKPNDYRTRTNTS